MKPIKAYAIRALCPNADFAVIGADETIRWVDMKGDSVPSDSAIAAKLTELTTAYDNKKYQRDRKVEYPSIVDQLDKIYHDGISKWKSDMIKPIKDKYPKE